MTDSIKVSCILSSTVVILVCGIVMWVFVGSSFSLIHLFFECFMKIHFFKYSIVSSVFSSDWLEFSIIGVMKERVSWRSFLTAQKNKKVSLNAIYSLSHYFEKSARNYFVLFSSL